ncbi:MAG: hypothetical protein JOZ23_09420 [Mycobacterium sp.]|nr:hypothetical protein [Mycobacterium sp.]
MTSVALAIVFRVGQLEIKTMMHQMPAPEAAGVGFTKTRRERGPVRHHGKPDLPQRGDSQGAGVPPDKLAEFTAAIPIGRLAAPDEGAPAVGLVASAAAG